MNDFKPGLAGVVAFETEIAEPDREGGSLRYRGVDIEELVGKVPFEQVWGLLVDGALEPCLPPAEPHPLAVHSGDPRVDVQSALAMLAPEWGFRSLIDISDEQARDDLARASVMALSFVAQSARGAGRPGPPRRGGGGGPAVRPPARRGAGGARRSRSARSTRRARSPSVSSSAGAARRIPTTSRRSTRTGTRRRSTA